MLGLDGGAGRVAVIPGPASYRGRKVISMSWLTCAS